MAALLGAADLVCERARAVHVFVCRVWINACIQLRIGSILHSKPEKSNFEYMHAVCGNLQQTYLEKAATDVQNKIKDAERKKIENKPKVRRLG